MKIRYIPMRGSESIAHIDFLDHNKILKFIQGPAAPIKMVLEECGKRLQAVMWHNEMGELLELPINVTAYNLAISESTAMHRVLKHQIRGNVVILYDTIMTLHGKERRAYKND